MRKGVVQMDYKTEPLTLEQTADIYTRWLCRHFPENEIKPLSSIRRMWRMGAYQALGLYERQGENTGSLAGYAFFVGKPGESRLLLDYLAIVEEYRGSGAGSSFLWEMRRQFASYEGILIETEDVEYAADDAQRVERQRRDSFYERNGAVRTGVKGCVCGVHYTIWELPAAGCADREQTRKNLEALYRVIMPEEAYDQYVRIS